jgi:hypothetical protein
MVVGEILARFTGADDVGIWFAGENPKPFGSGNDYALMSSPC